MFIRLIYLLYWTFSQSLGCEKFELLLSEMFGVNKLFLRRTHCSSISSRIQPIRVFAPAPWSNNLRLESLSFQIPADYTFNKDWNE